MTPEEVLALSHRFEDALLAATAVRCAFLCRADKPIDADLEGTLELSAQKRVSLRADGRLRGVACHVRLRSDGLTVQAEAPGRTWSTQSPSDLYEAIAIGWLRLGLTDCIVQIANGDLPREASGRARRNITVSPLSVVEPDDLNPHLANTIGLGCFVRVRGRDTQTATLWVDRDDAHPVQRTVTISVPTLAWSGGVGEGYWDIAVE